MQHLSYCTNVLTCPHLPPWRPAHAKSTPAARHGAPRAQNLAVPRAIRAARASHNPTIILPNRVLVSASVVGHPFSLSSCPPKIPHSSLATCRILPARRRRRWREIRYPRGVARRIGHRGIRALVGTAHGAPAPRTRLRRRLPSTTTSSPYTTRAHRIALPPRGHGSAAPGGRGGDLGGGGGGCAAWI
jgi:hypothetical protein